MLATWRLLAGLGSVISIIISLSLFSRLLSYADYALAIFLLYSAWFAVILVILALINDHVNVLLWGFLGFAYLSFFILFSRRISNRLFSIIYFIKFNNALLILISWLLNLAFTKLIKLFLTFRIFRSIIIILLNHCKIRSIIKRIK